MVNVADPAEAAGRPRDNIETCELRSAFLYHLRCVAYYQDGSVGDLARRLDRITWDGMFWRGTHRACGPRRPRSWAGTSTCASARSSEHSRDGLGNMTV